LQYTNLHCHDYYSTLDGLSSPEEYMKRAKELGMTHLAQTNHGTLSGHRHFQRAAKEAGVVPILGVEAYISATDRFDKRAKGKRQDGTNIYNHIILLADGEEGLRNLNRLSHIGWSEGFYAKPRIDFEVLEEHKDGLIILSGCMNGLIAHSIRNGNFEEADAWAIKFKEAFGSRFYMEIQDHNPVELNVALLDMADKYQIKPVITDDCHYADPKDKWIEEAFLILSANPKMNKDADLTKAQKMDLFERFNYLYPDRMMTFEQLDIYLAGYNDRKTHMENQGIDREDIFYNTQEIASRIGEYPYYEGLTTIPFNEDSHDILINKCKNGMMKRGLDGKPEYEARLEHELKIISDKNFEPYFLVVSDALSWAKSQGIMVGPGRGSSAGSLVCYVMEITEVDPLKYGLLFERFLDPGRSDWPDIDTDIEDKRRNEVKTYLEKKYGNVAGISTLGIYKGKNALKDASRVMGVPFSEINKLMKVLDGVSESRIVDEFEKNRETAEFRKKYPDVVKLARELLGRIKTIGMHPAGVIVSDKPISNYVGMETRSVPSADERIPVVAVDLSEADSIGLIKVDLLGLKNLTAIKDCVELIRERHSKIIDPWNLPLNDQKTFELLNKGLTAGVFQFEGASSTKLMGRIGPQNFNDLVITTSVVRTGAWKAIGEDYLATRRGEKRAIPIHESTREFTEETLYFVVYQEQLMRLCTDLAGMSVGDANKVRKITAKKQDPKLLAEYKQKFIDGATQKITRVKAEKIWEAFEIAAEYMFNKSHAVAYMLVSYATAWLKAHYPTEFMCALLRNEQDADKKTEYLLECKQMGIGIQLPHINTSEAKFKINGNDLQFGLSGIKYISDKVADNIMRYRPYANYEQFKNKVLEKGSGLNTRVLESLNAIGGAVFPDNPIRENYRDNLYAYLGIPAFETNMVTPRMKENMRKLEEYTDDETFICMAMVKSILKKDTWARLDLVDSTGVASVFVDPETHIEKGKMYVFLIGNNSIIKYISLNDLDSINQADEAVLDYLRKLTYEDIEPGQYKVISGKQRTTKAGKKMAHIVFCDHEKNLMTLPVWPNMFMKARAVCTIGSIRAVDIGKMPDGTKFVKDVY